MTVHNVERPEMQMGLRHCLLHKDKGIYILKDKGKVALKFWIKNHRII